MSPEISMTPALGFAFERQVKDDSSALRRMLEEHNDEVFRPTSEKVLRKFSSKEAAALIGVTDAYLRQLAANGEIEEPEKGPQGRHLYSLDEVHDARRYLGKAKPSYLPNRRGDEKLQLISVGNFKGGSGKTTTAVHLVQYLALRGYRVLAIDLDPQASMTTMFGLQPEYDVGAGGSFYGALRYDSDQVPISKVIRKSYFAGADLIPADVELQEFEHQTAVYAGRGDLRAKRFFLRIAESLDEVEADYDIVVFDCPPQLGYSTIGALCASTSFLLTVHPQMLDVASMNQFLSMASDMLEVVTAAGGSINYDWMRYLVTRHDPYDGPQAEIVAFLRRIFGDRVMPQMMVKSTAVSDAGISKLTLYDVQRESFHRNTYDRAHESLQAVNGEIERLIKLAWGRPV